MVKIFKTSSLRAAVFIGLFAGAAQAQDTVQARIPFSFVVGTEEFPAGRYEFTTSQSILKIRGRDNGKGMFALVNPAAGRDPNGEEPVLIFSRYENTYRLTDIWNSETRGLSLVTRRVRNSMHRVASNEDTVLITLAANEAK